MAQKDKPPSAGGQAFAGGVPGMTYRQWLVGQMLDNGYPSETSENRDRRILRTLAVVDRTIIYLSMSIDRLDREEKLLKEA